MSHLLAHKSIGLAKATHGHQPDKKTGEIGPVDTLIDRNQQWKHITKSLLHYYKGLSAIEASAAKATTALTETIQVPFHEGHQFLGDGGWQEQLYAVRDKTKVLSEHHSALATTLDKTVVQELEGVRSELKAHIAAIEKEAGTLATEVAKERANSATALTTLQTGIETFENSSHQMLPQHDPYLTHAQAHAQLKKQVYKENDLQAALIRFQQQQPAFEEGIHKSIQSAARLFDEAYASHQKEIEAVHKEIAEAVQKVSPDAEYKFYAAKEGAVLDPNSPTRSIEHVSFPGMNHAASVSIKEGPLERKKRFTKAYKESHYVLTPSGYLHERKSSDDVNDITPTFSLFLPECSLSAPAKESDKSHKFHLEGNKAVKSSFESKVKNSLRFGGKEIAYSFRARTHHEMMGWWEEVDKLTRDTANTNPGPTVPKSITPIHAAVANVGFAEPIVEHNAAPDLPVAEGGVVTPVTPAGHAAEPEATAEDDEEEGGSSAEEEEEEARAIRTAPSTPAAVETAKGKDVEAESAATATGPAETLPSYTGNGNTAAEKAALHEKGAPPALGAASSS